MPTPRRRRAWSVALLLTGSCAMFADAGPADARTDRAVETLEARLRDLEVACGGRLGVALVAPDGRVIAGRRAAERFAMCSTFKAFLAAAILQQVDAGRVRLDAQVTFDGSARLDYAPRVGAALDAAPGGSTRLEVGALVAAILEVSDNAAANLLLGMVGGPSGLTATLRSWGDPVTRLDRVEPALNENRRGDPRDTSTPAAMAATLHRLLTGEVLTPASRNRWEEWLRACATGATRIRAGLPARWSVGDKTGTGATARNDVAVIRPAGPTSPPWILVVDLDRPSVGAEAADATIADVARAAAAFLAARL